MTIAWTKCSERMPPDGKTTVMLKHSNGQFTDCYGSHANLILKNNNNADYTWAPYTPEAWAELNRK